MLSDDPTVALEEYELILRHPGEGLVVPLAGDLGTVFGLDRAAAVGRAVQHYVRTGTLPPGAAFAGDARECLDELRETFRDPSGALVTLALYGNNPDSEL